MRFKNSNATFKEFNFIVSPPPSTSYTSGQGSKSSKLVIALLVIAAAWYHFGFGIISLSEKKCGFPLHRGNKKPWSWYFYNIIISLFQLLSSLFQLLSLDHNFLLSQLVFTHSGFTIWICCLLTYFQEIEYSKHRKQKRPNKNAFKSTTQKLI